MMLLFTGVYLSVEEKLSGLDADAKLEAHGVTLARLR